MEKQLTEKEMLVQHFNNVCVAVENFVGKKQDHINLEISLNAIKKKLFDEKIDTSLSPAI